ncbi:MAG TPA: RagB/SusD family nutrient uptake outer membrane protein [Longimicrobiales bacterium]
MRRTAIQCIALAALIAAGCDNPLDIDPTDRIDSPDALTTPRALELAINGAYSALQTAALYSREVVVFPEMYADNLEFTGTFTTHQEVWQRNIFPTNGAILAAWADSYAAINDVNNVLAAIPEVEDLDEEDANRLRGEALFLRALNYLNLVRYFGGVPLVLEPSVGVGPESQVPRNTQAEVYAQIAADLEEAATLLPPDGGPGRATQAAANALLARAYLEMGGNENWTKAVQKASTVIGGGFAMVEDYGDLFAAQNTGGSIFELQYTVNDNNNLAFWYFPADLGGRYGFAPTEEVYDAYEPGDERRDVSIGVMGNGDLYARKYFRVANGDDNVIILRLSEMYLIRAEANAYLDAAPATVRADIDMVRNRAGLPDLPTTVDTQDELIDAILQERRVEFAFEGYRFFDLRRNGRATTVLGIDEDHLLFPIPQAEIDVNPNLEQNPGY